MALKLVEVEKKGALTSTGFDYWAAQVDWAKIKTNMLYSIIEWFNMQGFFYIKKFPKKKIFLRSNLYLANIV